jgi:hypothetical protein
MRRRLDYCESLDQKIFLMLMRSNNCSTLGSDLISFIDVSRLETERTSSNSNSLRSVDSAGQPPNVSWKKSVAQSSTVSMNASTILILAIKHIQARFRTEFHWTLHLDSTLGGACSGLRGRSVATGTAFESQREVLAVCVLSDSYLRFSFLTGIHTYELETFETERAT